MDTNSHPEGCQCMYHNGGRKMITKVLGILLIVLVGLFIADKAYSLVQTFQNKNPKNTIAITAEGKASAIPDIATVNLGVLTSGDTAEGVQNESTKKINKIVDYVKAQGVAKEDINTSQFNIYPQQDYKDGKTTITGYQANQTITIKVRGVDKSTEALGKILSGVTSNGANQINGVNLSFDDPDNLRQVARQEAISKAKEKAQQLAEAAGLRLGKVVSISESGGYGVPVPLYGDAYGIGGSGGAEKAVAPNVEPGNQDITASMTVIFEVK